MNYGGNGSDILVLFISVPTFILFQKYRNYITFLKKVNSFLRFYLFSVALFLENEGDIRILDTKKARMP